MAGINQNGVDIIYGYTPTNLVSGVTYGNIYSIGYENYDKIWHIFDTGVIEKVINVYRE